MHAISFLCSLFLSCFLFFAPNLGLASDEKGKGSAAKKTVATMGEKKSAFIAPEFLPLEKIAQLNYWQRVRYLTEWRDTLAAVESYSNSAPSNECYMAYHKSTKVDGICENPAPCEGRATGSGVSCNALVVGNSFCVPKSEIKSAASWCNAEAERVSTKEKSEIEKALNDILESHTKSASAQKILEAHAAVLKKYSHSPMIQAFALRLAFETNQKSGKWPQGFESVKSWNDYSETAKVNISSLANQCGTKNKKQKNILNEKACRSFMDKIAEARDSFSAISATLPDPTRDDSVAFLEQEMNSRMPASIDPGGPELQEISGASAAGPPASDANTSAASGAPATDPAPAPVPAPVPAPAPTPVPAPAPAPAAAAAPKYTTMSFGCDYPQMGRRSENKAGEKDIRVPFSGEAINCAVCPVVSAIRASKEVSWYKKQSDLACDTKVRGVRCSGLGISPRWLTLLNIAARTCQGIAADKPVDYETLMQYVQTFGACSENTAPFKDIHFESTGEEASYKKDTDRSFFSWEDRPMKRYELNNVDANMADLKALQNQGATVVDRDSRNYLAKRKEFRLKAVYGMSPENLRKYFCPEKLRYDSGKDRQPDFLKEMAKKRSQNVDNWTAHSDIKACAKEAFADPGSVARKIFSSSNKMCLASAPINSETRMPALSENARAGLSNTFQQQEPTPVASVVTYDKGASYQGCSNTSEMRTYPDQSKVLVFDEPSRRVPIIEVNGSGGILAFSAPGYPLSLQNKNGRNINAIHTLSSSVCPDSTDTPKGTTGATSSGTISSSDGKPINSGNPGAGR